MPRLNNPPRAAAPELAPTLRLTRRFWLLNVVGWLVICGFFYSRTWLVSYHRNTTFTPLQDGLETLGAYIQWALYTPFIVWISRYVPLMRTRRTRAGAGTKANPRMRRSDAMPESVARHRQRTTAP